MVLSKMKMILKNRTTKMMTTRRIKTRLVRETTFHSSSMESES